MLPKPPCKNCEQRQVGCHSSCEKYIKWKSEYVSQRKAENLDDATIGAYVKDRNRANKDRRVMKNHDRRLNRIKRK